MAFDEARHDPLARGVDGLHVLSVLNVDLWGDLADAEDAVALQYNGVICVDGWPVPSMRVPLRIMVVFTLLLLMVSSSAFHLGSEV